MYSGIDCKVSNNFNNEITTGHPAEDSWVEGLTYIKKIKLNVSATEECSWCSFGLSKNSDLKILNREDIQHAANSKSVSRLASEHSRKSSSHLRIKSYKHAAIEIYTYILEKPKKLNMITTNRLFTCRKKLTFERWKQRLLRGIYLTVKPGKPWTPEIFLDYVIALHEKSRSGVSNGN